MSVNHIENGSTQLERQKLYYINHSSQILICWECRECSLNALSGTPPPRAFHEKAWISIQAPPKLNMKYGCTSVHWTHVPNDLTGQLLMFTHMNSISPNTRSNFQSKSAQLSSREWKRKMESKTDTLVPVHIWTLWNSSEMSILA